VVKAVKNTIIEIKKDSELRESLKKQKNRIMPLQILKSSLRLLIRLIKLR
jgi:hypothetical protein